MFLHLMNARGIYGCGELRTRSMTPFVELSLQSRANIKHALNRGERFRLARHHRLLCVDAILQPVIAHEQEFVTLIRSARSSPPNWSVFLYARCWRAGIE